MMSVTDAGERERLRIIQHSGVFDGAWVVERNPDLPKDTHGALIHWHRHGWQEDRWPNPYFDTAYYRSHMPDAPHGDPLLHYIEHGEAAGRRPTPFFNPAWYRTTYGVTEGLCLAHYLLRRFTGTVSPMPEFDSAYYLLANPDVAEAGMDPMEHYLIQGFREYRLPHAGFDLRRHRRSWANQTNPLLDVLEAQTRRGSTSIHNAAAEVRLTTSPHAAFEAVSALPKGVTLQAKLLAFYLPQFHPVPENDAAWGNGFTEWTNLQRATPRFTGHYQPRIPRDLGHYRLDQADTLRRQVALAQGAGLHGFVHYFYWFNGRRLMDVPLNALLADPSIAFPFCLMWANTRVCSKLH